MHALFLASMYVYCMLTCTTLNLHSLHVLLCVCSSQTIAELEQLQETIAKLKQSIKESSSKHQVHTYICAYMYTYMYMYLYSTRIVATCRSLYSRMPLFTKLAWVAKKNVSFYFGGHKISIQSCVISVIDLQWWPPHSVLVAARRPRTWPGSSSWWKRSIPISLLRSRGGQTHRHLPMNCTGEYNHWVTLFIVRWRRPMVYSGWSMDFLFHCLLA